MDYQFQNTKRNKIPELLVPVGNLNTLEYAISYGADAVYLGGKRFNLRSLGSNFTVDELKKASEYAHNKNVKIYLTLNSIVFESEIDELKKYLNEIKEIDFDGFIISDPGIINLINNYFKNPRIHISTQTNITNHLAVDFYSKIGASRVNIAREVKYKDLKDIIKKSKIEIEVFVHGALCISYSGRCMLSKYMSGRDANKGECAHSCRWKYYLLEEQRPNIFYNIIQESDGTYIYNSRDLCLISKLDLLVQAGVSALKIEGRMKTESYISQTVWAYRKALDYIYEDKFTDENKIFLLNELNKCSHRNYTLGYMFLDDLNELEDNEGVKVCQDYKFIGVCREKIDNFKIPLILVKNHFNKGEVIEILEPHKMPREVIINEIKIVKNNLEFSSDEANPNDTVILKDIGNIDRYAILRKKVSNNGELL